MLFYRFNLVCTSLALASVYLDWRTLLWKKPACFKYMWKKGPVINWTTRNDEKS